MVADVFAGRAELVSASGEVAFADETDDHIAVVGGLGEMVEYHSEKNILTSDRENIDHLAKLRCNFGEEQ